MAKVNFTAGRIAEFTCESGAAQRFLWDSEVHGLGLRVTAAGARSYIFQGSLARRALRMTIGDVSTLTIPEARKRARELQGIIDAGRDPRAVKAERTAADLAVRERRELQGVTVAQAWAAYVDDRRPTWGERHAADHEAMVRPGGAKPKRGVKGGKLTIAGPLHALMALRLAELDAGAVEAWAKREADTRPTRARLALRMLKAFLSWAATHPEYRGLVPTDHAGKSRKAREALGRPGAKRDVLLKEQLAVWFKAVRAMPNPMHAAYAQILLLTGARPGEIHSLRWDAVGATWRSLALRDKVESDGRVVPLTPYVASLLAALPRRNLPDGTPSPWVFSSAAAADGRMAYPTDVHARACRAAGVAVTLHGLRRSFKSLTEWTESPVGVVAQIQGHRPSATVERHYVIRPLDLLRVHAERIEAWILEQAGIEFVPSAPAGPLRLIAGK